MSPSAVPLTAMPILDADGALVVDLRNGRVLVEALDREAYERRVPELVP